MARREQTGSGGARESGRTGASQSSGRRSSGRRSRGARTTRQTTRRSARATNRATRQTTAPGERPTAGSAWSGGSGSVGSPSPLHTLSAEQSSPDTLLTLVGAEQGALRETLQAWSAASDLAANRAWRRPGGLARMAGL